AYLQCIEENCRHILPVGSKAYVCPKCKGLLDVNYEFHVPDPEDLKRSFLQRRLSNAPLDLSGVWRYRELIPFCDDLTHVVTMQEGNTPIYTAPRCAEYTGLKNLYLKHQGLNPTGSFKDNGMTTGITQARQVKSKVVACASTGNTSASMAAYAARARMKAVIFIPDQQIAFGKLSQSLDYGALTLQIEGDFDEAMRLVKELTEETPIYLLNSINPYRLEGQKTIVIEMLAQRDWNVPDRIIVPGGNLGNSASFGKAIKELHDLGFIRKMPMVTIIQAQRANPLYRTLIDHSPRLIPIEAHTLATAIKIGNPVSWKKAVRAMEWTRGWCDVVSEQEIADAKAIIGRDGIGCEPASATTVAGIKRLIQTGEIDKHEDVVAVLTGNLLKDPDYTLNYHQNSLYELARYRNELIERKDKLQSTYANAPHRIKPDKEAIVKLLEL
ncbi:MAG: threonine synthase, partial [Terriglobia bacterium]